MPETVAYPPREASTEQASRSRSRAPERSRSESQKRQASRAPSPVLEVSKSDSALPADDRSRSRDPLLPIQERGRSRVDRVAQQLARATNRELVKGQARLELGRFARSFARRVVRPQVPERAPSQPPPKIRTFDEIDALTSGEQPIAQRALPYGAMTQRQRVNSLGDARVRFQGRPVTG